jgi:hypothetical protein
MSRQAVNPIDRAFSNYVSLTPQERTSFNDRVAGYNASALGVVPTAPRRRSATTKNVVASRAVVPATPLLQN